MAKGSPLWKSSLVSGSAAVCPYCHQWLQADNHRVRLRPKRRPSAHVQSILRRKARGKQLSLMQKKLLRRFQTSSSTVMATCQTCHKTSRHKGMSREFIATLSKAHSTPGSAGKNKTPQASNRANMTTPKSAGKDKTPGSTPRSSSSHPPGSGSSSSKKTSREKTGSFSVSARY